ncbi:helix-hairpin-helix domain-containing protein [Pedobacter sp. KR3-3]|uniref:Helix-hairpin-helix domain-containing protein n=1 Tax=Pedobacter albus TaxID=3113905 RepID=A0ABU7I7U3_9SPHI|nr:helix-hairpin-helix domain-containing protein [Pedobacter sp. KR3-3]MEE1945538.1 helix-hairpin-helix domain-containing protein [Pedobacter sp. KR3-3]
MKNWLNKYFGFTKREYNGLLFLMAVLLFLAVFPYVYDLLKDKQEPATAVEVTAIKQLELVNMESDNRDGYAYPDHARAVRKAPELFRFDPNQIDASQWQSLGLSAKQAQSIINYRNKGGRFYKAEDLQKMYVISPEMYARLKSYVTIEGGATDKFENKQPFHKDTNPRPQKELAVIEINGADTVQLQEIRGIGPAFAKRIANYRERLGGFYRKEQLLEVFGLDSAKFEGIKDQVRVDAGQLKKININTAVFDELKNNPYLKYKQINAIIQYRKQHGPYKAIEDLRKVAILTPQNIQNLAPYLTF